MCHAIEHVQNIYKNLENLETQITNNVSTYAKLDLNGL